MGKRTHSFGLGRDSLGRRRKADDRTNGPVKTKVLPAFWRDQPATTFDRDAVMRSIKEQRS